MEFQLSLSPDSINQLISDIKVSVFILIKSQSVIDINVFDFR